MCHEAPLKAIAANPPSAAERLQGNREAARRDGFCRPTCRRQADRIDVTDLLRDGMGLRTKICKRRFNELGHVFGGSVC